MDMASSHDHYSMQIEPEHCDLIAIRLRLDCSPEMRQVAFPPQVGSIRIPVGQKEMLHPLPLIQGDGRFQDRAEEEEKRYPLPRTVRIRLGWSGSGSIFCRKRDMCGRTISCASCSTT
jgi:hypothetical protein